uniref:(northern house mosquito) hypothetical protein n=1 Tax=Culex pipiens TaxID=7175 RepID=A0A8D8CFJ2_CULPI
MENFEKTTEETINDVDYGILRSVAKLQSHIGDLECSVNHPMVTLFTDGALHAELAAYVKYIRELPENDFGDAGGAVEPDWEDQELDYEIRELQLFIQNAKDAVRELVGEDGPEGVRDVDEIHRKTSETKEEYRKTVEEKRELLASIAERKKEAKQRRHDLEMVKDGLKAQLEESTSTNKKLQQESTKLQRELDLLKSRLARKKGSPAPRRHNWTSLYPSEEK